MKNFTERPSAFQIAIRTAPAGQTTQVLGFFNRFSARNQAFFVCFSADFNRFL
jgi:hypothetical protein